MTALDISAAGSENINPARSAALITPHDTNELGAVTRAIKIGNTGGNIVVQMADQPIGSVVTIPVQAGDWLPIQVRLVKLTGTTATTIIGFW
jgi:hypothetical protein